MSAPMELNSTETWGRPRGTARTVAFDRETTAADLQRLPLASALEVHDYLSELDCGLVEQLCSTEVWPYLGKLDWKSIESLMQREHCN
jgi:hypothetical protein